MLSGYIEAEEKNMLLLAGGLKWGMAFPGPDDLRHHNNLLYISVRPYTVPGAG